MRESFEQSEKKIGERFLADERKKYQAMVDHAVESGAVPASLAETLKDPGVETMVRLAVLADRDLKTAPVISFKDNGLFTVFAKSCGDPAACVDGMLALATIGLKDLTFGFVPSSGDTSDVAMYTRRHPGAYLLNPPKV